MNTSNLIQLARAKKLESVLTYLGLAFKDFAYPVYLFGSYATGHHHGHSDVDVLIIAPDALAKKIYLQACDKMAGLGMNYDILISPSIKRLDSSIVTSLQAINVSVQPCQTSAAPSRHQLGLTLIEIMIALLIGAFLLGGLLQIFTGSKQTYRMQEGLSRLQENGRFAMDFLAHDIRMAGYWGCLSPSSPDTDITGANDNAVAGDSIDNGTDTITLKGMFVLTPAVACGTAANAADSCGPGVICSADPSSTIAYKIDKAALYQNNESLVEGIENMQILYGVDTEMNPATMISTDYVPNYYVPANPLWVAADWAKVVSIRISLLTVTLDDNLTAQPVSYTYNGATTTPTDRKLRRVFNATIALRNRLP